MIDDDSLAPSIDNKTINLFCRYPLFSVQDCYDVMMMTWWHHQYYSILPHQHLVIASIITDDWSLQAETSNHPALDTSTLHDYS